MQNGYFFLKKAFNDIINPYRFGVSKSYKIDNKNNFEEYPYGLDFTTSGMLEYYGMIFDRNGIVMFPHYVGNQSRDSHYYSPVKIAHYALAAYNDFLKCREEKYKNIVLTHTNYLIKITNFFKNDSNTIVWPTPTNVARYNVKAGFLSALVQGLAISLFVRAYLLLKDDLYLELAEKALNILNIPVEENGTLAHSKWGKFYEEYPCEPYSHVVNGFIFCLIGLFDLYIISHSAKAKKMYFEGLETLTRVTPDWILPYWSKYDLYDITNNCRINLATRHYQYLHIDLTSILAEQTKDQFFRNVQIKLEEQLTSPINNARIYFNKLPAIIKYI